MEGFYYNRLSTTIEKEIYETLAEGFLHHKKSILIPKMDVQDLNVLYQKVFYDLPQLLHIRLSKVVVRGQRMEMLPEYRLSREQRRIILGKIEEKVKPILEKTAEKATAEEKEKWIHDFLANTVSYGDINDPAHHEMSAVFLRGKGVCDSISKAFLYLCLRSGIPAGIAVGKNEEGILPGSNLHSWNMVCIQDKWYQVDMTYDICASTQYGVVRYDYFNLSDRELPRKTLFDVPKCERAFHYYFNNGLYADTRTRLKEIFKHRKSESVTVQLPAIPDCSQEDLMEYIKEAVIEEDCLNVPITEESKIYIYPNFGRNIFTIGIK